MQTTATGNEAFEEWDKKHKPNPAPEPSTYGFILICFCLWLVIVIRAKKYSNQ